jgi:hypothetical protein
MVYKRVRYGARFSKRKYNYNALLDRIFENDRKGYYEEAKRQGMSYGYAKKLKHKFKLNLMGLKILEA